MKKYFAILALTMVVASCGTSKTDRALSGGGIGAAVGAAGAAVLDKDPLAGAAIGGAVGAAGGALTNENDVNLGNPIWK